MLCNGLTIKIWEDGRCPVTPNFAKKALELRSGFDIIDRGRFVVVHPFSTLSLQS